MWTPPEMRLVTQGGVSNPWDALGKPAFTAQPLHGPARRVAASANSPPLSRRGSTGRAALLLLAAFALVSSACFAQTGEPDSGTQIRYQVEFIAFEYQGPDSSAGEVLDTLPVSDYLPAPAFDQQAYQRLRATVTHTDISVLSGALQELRASPQYSVLTTSAWIQPLLGQSAAVTVPIGQDPRSTGFSAGPPAPRVSGSVQVFGSRLLFVDVGLRATLPRGDRGAPAVAQEPGETATGEYDRDSFSRTQFDDNLVTYQISEKRRIKLEEVHYFDHPRIGVLLYVARYGG